MIEMIKAESIQYTKYNRIHWNTVKLVVRQLQENVQPCSKKCRSVKRIVNLH